MDSRTISLYLSRILSGYYYIEYRNSRYKIQYPDMDLKYEADYLSEKEFNNNRFAGWYTKESIVPHLKEIGAWSEEEELELARMENSIEKYKIELYENRINLLQVDKIRAKLEITRESFSNLYYLKHCYDHVTIEGYCDSIKNDYLLGHCIYDEKGKLPFIKDYDARHFKEISQIVARNSIEQTQFKKIARSGLWRNYWSSNKNDLFGKPAIKWTDEQKSLVILTKMYDNAREHSESPPEDVFEDDDMFEGWMLYQDKKAKKERAKKDIDKKLGGKIGNAGEVFLMARNQEEAQKIYEINDPLSRTIINERQEHINKSNEQIQDSKLPDIQRENIIKSKQQQKRKGP